MKICIIGQGYIGLPTAALFANSNCNVLGVDRNQPIVDALNQGDVHIEEPGIRKILKVAISQNKFRASLSPEESDVFIITVPTPTTENSLSCDLSNVFSACGAILPYLKENNIVIIESTIAPMSTDEYIKPIFEKEGWKIGKDLYLSHCPERVLPGKIMHELVNNDRIIGGITPKCADKSAEVYKKFVKGNLIKTEAKTAELAKCMENTFRDVNIALANELAKICSKIGVNALDVIKMANKHPRVNIHHPGPGVGGHCLAIDPYFIYSMAPDTAKLIKIARDTNNSMPHFVVENTEKLINSTNDSNNPTIAILGVAYKGNIGDIRESPALEIIELFKNKDYNVKIHDPHVNNESYLNLEDAITDAAICVVLADHDEFKNLNYDLLISKMNAPLIFDTKNIVKTERKDIKVVNFGNLHHYI
ncbi:MAG: nucleotide sugar dehydrogenase [Methanobrevibacter sp.]|nr:nucleotide sugar dehydrogenase [Methanobrevibacter sp.]